MKINITQETLEYKVKKSNKNLHYIDVDKETFIKLTDSIIKSDNDNYFDFEKNMECGEGMYNDDGDKIIILPIKIRYGNEKVFLYLKYDDKVPFYDTDYKAFYLKTSKDVINLIPFDKLLSVLKSFDLKDILKHSLFVFGIKDCGVTILNKIRKIYGCIIEYKKETNNDNEKITEKIKRFHTIYTHANDSYDFTFALSSEMPIISDIIEIIKNCGGLLL